MATKGEPLRGHLELVYPSEYVKAALLGFFVIKVRVAAAVMAAAAAARVGVPVLY